MIFFFLIVLPYLSIFMFTITLIAKLTNVLFFKKASELKSRLLTILLNPLFWLVLLIIYYSCVSVMYGFSSYSSLLIIWAILIGSFVMWRIYIKRDKTRVSSEMKSVPGVGGTNIETTFLRMDVGEYLLNLGRFVFISIIGAIIGTTFWYVYSQRDRAFDSMVWKNDNPGGYGEDDKSRVRILMVKDMLRKFKLKGMTKAEIQNLLGPARADPSSDHILQSGLELVARRNALHIFWK